MYHLTTDTGLTTDVTTPAAVGAALHAEITAHADTRPVAWAISIDGLTGQHLGDISVYLGERDSTDFIDDTVKDLVEQLINDPPPLPAHRAPWDDPHMSNPDPAQRLLRLQRVAQTDNTLRNLLADGWHFGYGAGIDSKPGEREQNPFHMEALNALPPENPQAERPE